jgi:hypothetical protein
MMVRTDAFEVMNAQAMAFVLVVYIGFFTLAGLLLGGIAVAITGPRRWLALAVPTLVTGVSMVTIVTVGRSTTDDIPLVALASFGIALATAALQHMVLLRMERGPSRPLLIAGGALAGAALGLVVGALGALLAGSVIVVLFFVVFGTIVGLRIGVSESGPPSLDPALDPPVDAGRTPGILDE